MGHSAKCRRCGGILPREEASGSCPVCLLQTALDDGMDIPEATHSARNPNSQESPISRYFGDFEILEEVGRGGMGVIHRARQISLNRMVALKVIHPGLLLSAEARLRFRVEAEAAALLDHPHIVPIHESGEHSGARFFTMRYMEGGNLAMKLRSKRECTEPRGMYREHPFLSGSLSLTQFLCIVRAVHHAHQRGVLHRDLKPSNILLDAEGEPHVADFGLARLATRSGELTMDSSILGSPNYMSPEQAAGDSQALTVATDVYGLGTILYEMLTGRPPFSGATPIETLRSVCEREPISPRQIRATIDRDLEILCLKCLRKNPSDRYPSADALAQDLEHWRADRPILARPQGRFERVRRWIRRNPVATGAIAMVIFAVVSGSFGARMAWHRIREANHRTTDALTRMRLDKSEELLAADETSRGLALLAHLVRTTPDHAPTVTRLSSAIRGRSFAEPALRWTEPDSGAVAWIVANSNAVCVGANGKVFESTLTSPPSRHLLVQLERPAKYACFDTSGGRMIAGLDDGTVHLRSGHLFTNGIVLGGHRGYLVVGAFSSSGGFAATADLAGQVHLWEIGSGRPVGLPRRHPAGVTDVGFTPDGRFLATVAADGNIRFWPLETNGAPREIRLTQASARVLRFDPTGRRMAVGGFEGGIKVWSLQPEPRVEWSFSHQSRISDLDFNAAGDRLVSASFDDHAQVWNLVDGTRQGAALRHGARVNSARFRADGHWVVTASNDGTARVWDAATGRAITGQLSHKTSIMDARFHPGNSHVTTLGYDGTLQVWRLPEPDEPMSRIHPPSAVIHGSLDSMGNRIATVHPNGDVHIYDTQRGSLLRTIRPGRDTKYVSFSPDGSLLAAGLHSGSLKVFHSESGQIGASPPASPEPIRGIEFSQDGKWILTTHWSRAQIWDAQSGERRGGPLAHRDMIRSARFNTTGDRVVTAADDHWVKVWDPERANPVVFEVDIQAGLLAAEFSPDGKKLLVIPFGYTATLSSLMESNSPSLTFSHQRSITHAAFSSDGHRLVTSGEDGLVHVWDLRGSNRLVATLPHRSRMGWAEFGPHDGIVVSATADGQLCAWDVASRQLLADPALLPGLLRQAWISRKSGRFGAAGRDGTMIFRSVPGRYGDSESARRLADNAERLARMRFVPPDRFETLP